jgi:TIGR03009 family protein
MRRLGIFCLWLASTSILFAQGEAPPAGGAKGSAPAPKAAAEPVPQMNAESQQTLETVLKLWERRMATVEGLETKLIQSETETGSTEPTVSVGNVSLMRPNYAVLLTRRQNAPQNKEKWMHIIADGKNIYDFDHKAEVVRVTPLPKEGVDNTIMSFLFGMKTEEIKRRFDLYIDVKDPQKYNENFIHIMIYPRSREDRQEFMKAELVLWINKANPKFANNFMLPARLWMQKANKDQTTFDFREMDTQKAFTPKDFVASKPNAKWKVEVNQSKPTPAVVPVSGTKPIK